MCVVTCILLFFTSYVTNPNENSTSTILHKKKKRFCLTISTNFFSQCSSMINKNVNFLKVYANLNWDNNLKRKITIIINLIASLCFNFSTTL